MTVKKVLVTGASGFIGRQSLPELLRRGFEVHALYHPNGKANIHTAFPREILWYPCDLLREERSAELFKQIRPSHLLHFAWDTSHGKFWTSAQNLNWVATSLCLLKNFVEWGGERAVFAGSCAEYHWSEELLKENSSPLLPSTLYGNAKHALQLVFSNYLKQCGVSGAWGRIFFLYGPFEGENRLVSSAIRSLLKGEIFPATHGRQMRDFMHVEDVACAFVHLLDCDASGPVNIASGKAHSLAEVLQILESLTGALGLIQLGTRPTPVDEPMHIIADGSILHNTLKFTPHYCLLEGLSHTVEWWRSQIL